MVKWNYNNQVEQTKPKALPVGNYRCRIEEANEKTSQAGNEMIELVLKVSGHNSKLWFYIVFMPEGLDKNGNPLRDITDRNLKTVYDTFGIQEGTLNVNEWIGKIGGVKVKHEMVDGEAKAKVHYFLNKSQQVGLPAWEEEEGHTNLPVNSSIAPDDIQWDN